MSLFEDIPIRNVLILGNTTKFIQGIKEYFPAANRVVIPWRDSELRIMRSNVDFELFDLVFVCGYDYGSYTSTFDNYLNSNVYSVLAIIAKCSKCRKFVYVDTEDTNKTYTLSRYVYAKKLMGSLIVENVKLAECHIMKPCSIVTDKLDVHGSRIEVLLFRFLIKLKVVKFVNISSIFYNLLNNRYLVSEKVFCPTPVFLKFKRTRLIDRGLRFIYG